ncbi:Alkyl hydroperoxide reductase/peroxiredoxin [Phaffia rhodozyma]|uniref:Alkyl hydroperoxide reductase/peroxiredoxin n=1 Tax=Phaffia rhodozyma TaxID=264483 RepID=A0A0F7SHL4_PHARH|nr:Alkyl hydroperoxide reductase/peroxiredoxin [Phaffia rhodozyma]
MTSIVASATSAASAASAAISQTIGTAKVGGVLPDIPVKEDDPMSTISLPQQGKIVIIGVPGAFSPTCSEQVPGFIESYDKFVAKGVNDIFAVSINDAFVMKAWGKKLAPDGTKIRFIADDTGAFVSALGLVFDASAIFGGIRSKRFALYANDGKIEALLVENSPGDLETSTAEALLAKL